MIHFHDLLTSFGRAEHAGRAVMDMEQAHLSGPPDGLLLALTEAREAYRAAAQECQRQITSLSP
jgi:hypothetical protein